MQEVSHILRWAETNHSTISAVHIPEVENWAADFLSRQGLASGELELHPEVFRQICLRWGTLDVDLMASRLNAKVHNFIARSRDPQAIGVDALIFPWNQFQSHMCFLHFPYCRSQKIRSAIQESYRVRGTPIPAGIRAHSTRSMGASWAIRHQATAEQGLLWDVTWSCVPQCGEGEIGFYDKNRLSPDCETMTEHSLMSSDEGYDLSEYLCDSVLGSLEVGLENEEKIVRMGHRLRAAVERLLDMVTDSALKLEQTREMQKCFEDEFKSGNQDMAQVVTQNQELLKQLAKETEEKNQLQLELHKSQGLVDGFALEKATLEEALVSKESSEHRLAVELEKCREQVKILTQEPCVSGKEKEVLQRLQEVLSDSDIDAELLKETERLLKEELELHCQAKQDRSNLISQMKMLEMELEEQMSRNQELMRKTNIMTDLQQQIQSLEKQLKSQRQFMDEQAMEREHERDEFQQEIQKLEEQLKQAVKSHGDSKAHGIESLEARVKEKADDCKLLLQGREHLEQQITERNDEIDKMMIRIQELEQAVLSNADAAKKCSHLEAELQKMQKMEKEIMQDKEALEQQQFSNVLQISALQTKLDEARHRVPVEGDANRFLKQELQVEREALQRKEKEAESLVEQLEQFREELMNKTEEVFQLNMQLDVQRKQYERAVQQAQEEYLRLKASL
ncbi:unnamed protein product [Ranitomeya imitator]|uniref:Uncharacterized protein n=1 Tax=Ranitomeya imitator TaxID=111125 RepID=A0ABN9LZK5_9NEOB|nr:unnamed protein product [Ranitomeya imitator]